MAHLFFAPALDSKPIRVPVVGRLQTGWRRHTARDRRDTLVLNTDAPTDSLERTSVEGVPPGVLKRREWQQRHSMNLLVTDTLVVCAVVILAQYVRFGHAPASPSFGSQRATAYSILLIVLWLSALTVLRTRSPRVVANGTDEYRRVVSACFWTFGAVAIVGFLLKLEIARGYLAVALPSASSGAAAQIRLAGTRRVQARSGRMSNAVLAIEKRHGGQSRKGTHPEPEGRIPRRRSVHPRLRSTERRTPDSERAGRSPSSVVRRTPWSRFAPTAPTRWR